MHKKGIWVLILVGLILVVLIGVWIRQKSQKEVGVYEIGAVLFLTGEQANLGESVKNGLTIALDEINEAGGINGKKLKLLIDDSKNTAKDGIMAFNKLMMKKLPVVISTGDVVTLSLIPLADRNKTVLVATVAASKNIPQESDWVFRNFVNTDAQSKTVADYAYKNLNLKKVAVLRINNEFGLHSYEAFKEHFNKLGGVIPIVETFEIDQKDFRSTIAKIKATKPEGIYVTGFGPGYGALIKQLQEAEVPSVILTMDAFADPFWRRQAGGGEGVYYEDTLFDPSSQADKIKKFVNEYKKRYNSEPTLFAAFGYDTLYLIAEAIKRGGYSNEGIRKGLLSIQDYEGLMGKISFDSKGESKFGLVIRKIEGGKPKKVSDIYYW